MAIDTRFRETPPPGVYRGVAAVHYHGWDACSSSVLRKIASTTELQAHHKASEPSGPTKAQAFGQLTHDVVLLPELVDDLYAVHPPGNKNSNAYKAAKSKLLATRPFVTLIEQDDKARAEAIRDKIAAHPLAGPLMLGTVTELSIVWIDRDTGLTCKARIDAASPAHGGGDLKITSDLSDHAIASKVGMFRYDLQAAFYGEAIAAAREFGEDIGDGFSFVFGQDSAPHDIRVLDPEDRVIVAAEDELDGLKERYARAKATGKWPGYPATIDPLPVPGWLRNEIEYRTPDYLSRGVA